MPINSLSIRDLRPKIVLIKVNYFYRDLRIAKEIVFETTLAASNKAFSLLILNFSTASSPTSPDFNTKKGSLL